MEGKAFQVQEEVALVLTESSSLCFEGSSESSTASTSQTPSSSFTHERKISTQLNDFCHVGHRKKRTRTDSPVSKNNVVEETETNLFPINSSPLPPLASCSGKSRKISTRLVLFDKSWDMTIKPDLFSPKKTPKVMEKKIDLSRFRGQVKETEDGVSTELKLYDDTWDNAFKSDSLGPKKFPKAKEKTNLSRFRGRAEETEEGVSTELKLYDDPWKAKKILTKIDCVDDFRRLMISSFAITRHVKPQRKKQGISGGLGGGVRVWDYDTETEHVVTFERRLSDNNSRIFESYWKTQFMDRRELQIGDEIGLFWDSNKSRFGFRVLSRARTTAPPQG